MRSRSSIALPAFMTLAAACLFGGSALATNPPKQSDYKPKTPPLPASTPATPKPLSPCDALPAGTATGKAAGANCQYNAECSGGLCVDKVCGTSCDGVVGSTEGFRKVLTRSCSNPGTAVRACLPKSPREPKACRPKPCGMENGGSLCATGDGCSSDAQCCEGACYFGAGATKGLCIATFSSGTCPEGMSVLMKYQTDPVSYCAPSP